MLLEVETSPQTVLKEPNAKYSLTCTASIEVDSRDTSSPIIMKWTRHFGSISAGINTSSLTECNTTEHSGSCVVNTTNTPGVTFYHCTAQYKFSDVVVCNTEKGLLTKIIGMLTLSYLPFYRC